MSIRYPSGATQWAIGFKLGTRWHRKRALFPKIQVPQKDIRASTIARICLSHISHCSYFRIPVICWIVPLRNHTHNFHCQNSRTIGNPCCKLQLSRVTHFYLATFGTLAQLLKPSVLLQEPTVTHLWLLKENSFYLLTAFSPGAEFPLAQDNQNTVGKSM